MNASRRTLLFGAAAVLLTPAARATLGEDLASVQADALRLGAARRANANATPQFQVQVLTLPGGGHIRQFATPEGRVFAVAWNTPAKPRLDTLLGTHFAAYAEGGRQAQAQRAGVSHTARIAQGDLVVESTAHLNAHVGRAWLKSLWPAGLGIDALR